MIQAPQAYTPVQQQPLYRQQPQVNAVNIQIFDPKSFAQPDPTYAMPTNSVYTVPQQSVYNPAQPASQTPPAPPVPVPPPVVNTQNVNPPAPSVIPQQPQPTPAPAQTQAAPQTQTPEQPVTPPPAPQPTAAAPSFNTKGLAQDVKSDNLETAGAAIEKIADIAQHNPNEAKQLLDQELMESLLGVIAKDTTQLQDATPQQLQWREELLQGKTLTPEQTAEAQKISPKEMADRNKQYALFTVAILQDLLVKEFQAQNNVTPDIKDLPGMEQIVSTIKDNSSPMLRASGLAALAYNARPEYTPVMKEIFGLSEQDEDPNVRNVASDGFEKLANIHVQEAEKAQAANDKANAIANYTTAADLTRDAKRKEDIKKLIDNLQKA